MKNFCQKLNTILSVIILSIGVLQIFFIGSIESDTWIFFIINSLFLIIMSVIELIVGVYFKEEEKYLSRNQQKC